MTAYFNLPEEKMENINAKEVLISEIFREGTVFDQEAYTKIAKTLRPKLVTKRETVKEEHRANMELVSVQWYINYYLRKYGRCLKSRNYYTEFYVVQDLGAAKEVARYSRTAEALESYAETLRKGVATSLQARQLRNGQ